MAPPTQEEAKITCLRPDPGWTLNVGSLCICTEKVTQERDACVSLRDYVRLGVFRLQPAEFGERWERPERKRRKSSRASMGYSQQEAKGLHSKCAQYERKTKPIWWKPKKLNTISEKGQKSFSV